MEFDNVDTPERENRIECNGCLEPKKAGELSWVKTEGHNRYAVSILSILFITSGLQSCSHTWLTSQELFRNALGIHRVPYGSIGKHNGQRWTPGVREHCTVTDCPGVVPPWCWLCLCISAHFWSSLSVCQSIFDEDIDWGGAECVCSSLEMPRSWCLSCQGWDPPTSSVARLRLRWGCRETSSGWWLCGVPSPGPPWRLVVSRLVLLSLLPGGCCEAAVLVLHSSQSRSAMTDCPHQPLPAAF